MFRRNPRARETWSKSLLRPARHRRCFQAADRRPFQSPGSGGKFRRNGCSTFFGGGNTAFATQNGGGNSAYVSQQGSSNLAGTIQDGWNNKSCVIQKGNGHEALTQQYGNNNTSAIIQRC
ncbi:hypothetical protein [Parvibaculum sp.]|uniref:hypothetical protein n=1 Tax=Parvibaculum sp. TaxID=2024848 RepID=UPI000EEDB6A7|nr:hypothetical protein [Parvibaculum sp.]HCX67748.1 hypothetical protein [Rhodobiaceae bacterium]